MLQTTTFYFLRIWHHISLLWKIALSAVLFCSWRPSHATWFPISKMIRLPQLYFLPLWLPFNWLPRFYWLRFFIFSPNFLKDVRPFQPLHRPTSSSFSALQSRTSFDLHIMPNSFSSLANHELWRNKQLSDEIGEIATPITTYKRIKRTK